MLNCVESCMRAASISPSRLRARIIPSTRRRSRTSFESTPMWRSSSFSSGTSLRDFAHQRTVQQRKVAAAEGEAGARSSSTWPSAREHLRLQAAGGDGEEEVGERARGLADGVAEVAEE
jgi:hypothetical protein